MSHRRCELEKISGILPSSPRTRKVDVSGSQPVRPGAPAWGRPQGKVTIPVEFQVDDRVDFGGKEELGVKTYRPLSEREKAQSVQQLSEKFFNSDEVENVGEEFTEA